MSSAKLIYPFECEHKEEFIKRGKSKSFLFIFGDIVRTCVQSDAPHERACLVYFLLRLSLFVFHISTFIRTNRKIEQDNYICTLYGRGTLYSVTLFCRNLHGNAL